MFFLSLWKILIFLFVFPLGGTNSEELFQQANASYEQGEKAITYQERKYAFNRALFLYHILEEEISSRSSLFYQNLGDNYFQLGEYAWAILYYQRGLKKDHHPVLLARIEKAQRKLGLMELPQSQKRFWTESLLSIGKQFQLLFWLILFSFLACSALIWFRYSWLRKLAAISIICTCVMLGNFLFIYYFTPFEGILVTATGFYRAPDWNETQLTSFPLLAGTKVEILQITPDEKWLKITNSKGLVGYVPTSTLRSI